MEFDSGLATEYTEWVKNGSMITLSHERHPLNPDIATLVQSACRDAIAQTLQGIPCSKNTHQPYSVSAAEYEELSRTMTKNAGLGLADQIYLQLNQA